MRSGKAKECADATENDGKKKQKKRKTRFGKRFLAGVGKGLRELAVASSAVVVGAALTKLATREMRKPRVRKWTGALFAAKGGDGKDEADATPADFVEGWKPWFLQTIEPSRFDCDLEYVDDDDDELFEEEPSGLLIPVYDYEEEHDYGYGYEEETPSGLLIPVHVGDDYY